MPLEDVQYLAGHSDPRHPEMAVADDLLPPGLVLEVGVVVDPGGDLGLDGLASIRRAPSRGPR